MEIARTHNLTCSATASDQEGVAHLILSGGFLGFLPDHYAALFVSEGRMRPVAPQRMYYNCRYSVIHRKDPPPLRAARVFRACLISTSRNG